MQLERFKFQREVPKRSTPPNRFLLLHMYVTISIQLVDIIQKTQSNAQIGLDQRLQLAFRLDLIFSQVSRQKSTCGESDVGDEKQAGSAGKRRPWDNCACYRLSSDHSQAAETILAASSNCSLVRLFMYLNIWLFYVHLTRCIERVSWMEQIWME